MKTNNSVNFLIEKANNYITEINIFLTKNINSSLTDKRFMNPDDLSQLETRLNSIKELKLKIRLLFSEINNGNLFIENLIKRKTASDFIHISNKKVLESYKRTLELFIEHLKDYKLN